ncbi:hypothetical protein T484DRAFT_1863620 [Baffinella frigidus]|nr:hypothetical protein T484DRAFT_1863620 [Cryptophyta sp. CCMP2293]
MLAGSRKAEEEADAVQSLETRLEGYPTELLAFLKGVFLIDPETRSTPEQELLAFLKRVFLIK